MIIALSLLVVTANTLRQDVEVDIVSETSYTLASNRNVEAYLGNLHSHTSYSDGSGTPAKAYAYARDKAKLDFLAVTEHNHDLAEQGAKDRRDGVLIANDHSLYNGDRDDSVMSAANAITENGVFVALFGQEFSTISSGNHVIAFDAPKVITAASGRFDKLLTWLGNNHDSTNQRCVIQFNHPKDFHQRSEEYGADDFGTKAKWISRMDAVASLVELLNGPGMKKTNGNSPGVMESDFYRLLGLGFHLSPVADQDNHYKNWGTTTNARTGLVCNGLSRAGLLNAMRTGHSYASEDRNLRIVCWAQKKLAGEKVQRSPDGTLTFVFRIEDADESDSDYTIEILEGAVGSPVAETIATVTTSGDTPAGKVVRVKGVDPSNGADYVIVKIMQADANRDDRVWLAPIYLS
jgi:hypothetical protein